MRSERQMPVAMGFLRSYSSSAKLSVLGKLRDNDFVFSDYIGRPVDRQMYFGPALLPSNNLLIYILNTQGIGEDENKK